MLVQSRYDAVREGLREMDAELVTLASTAATTAVTLATTDAWGQAKQKLLALWRRFKPDQADAAMAELDQGHLEIQGADAAITRVITLAWESQLLRLLAADAAVAAELSRVVTELRALPATARGRGGVTQHVRADHSTVIQVAGDVHGGIQNRV